MGTVHIVILALSLIAGLSVDASDFLSDELQNEAAAVPEKRAATRAELKNILERAMRSERAVIVGLLLRENLLAQDSWEALKEIYQDNKDHRLSDGKKIKGQYLVLTYLTVSLKMYLQSAMAPKLIESMQVFLEHELTQTQEDRQIMALVQAFTATVYHDDSKISLDRAQNLWQKPRAAQELKAQHWMELEETVDLVKNHPEQYEELKRSGHPAYAANMFDFDRCGEMRAELRGMRGLSFELRERIFVQSQLGRDIARAQRRL